MGRDVRIGQSACRLLAFVQEAINSSHAALVPSEDALERELTECCSGETCDDLPRVSPCYFEAEGWRKLLSNAGIVLHLDTTRVLLVYCATHRFLDDYIYSLSLFVIEP